MTSFDPQWETIHKARAWGKYPNEQLVRFVFRHFTKPFSKFTALDLGCGGGAQTKFLGDEGFLTAGIDASQAAIDRCNIGMRLDNTHYRVENVSALTFSDASFDLVTDVCCLQHLHIDDAAVAIREVARVLRPGGAFFSVTARWSDTTDFEPPVRKMRRSDLTLYNQVGLHRIGLEHSEITDNDERLIVSHWQIAMLKT